ncbi:MAG: hypothetical protein M3320_04745 [Actinomycetota bacterium]|nr:hypothetical protein [Actinomycetota bacterium]MDQ5807964.1 hypothetical protein [Actinomycetota bacterium]
MSPRLLGTTALAAVALTAALPAADAAAPKRPSGTYESGKVLLSVAGGSIVLASFEFPCRRTTGRTSLNDVPVKRRRGRWRFSIRSAGSATYADDHPDENVRITFRGRFSPSARTAAGTFVVNSPYCGRTREISWTAPRSTT